MTITAQAADPVSLAAQAAGIPSADADTGPVPDDPVAIAMYTAHRTDDAGKHLAHASERLDAARDAAGTLRGYHMTHVAHHLGNAHRSAHELAAHLRARYPAEARDLDALTATIGLAVAVSDQARTATTSHLTQTICNHLGHTIEHVKAMAADPEPKVWDFNADHAATHLAGAAEHVAKLAAHLHDNYPAEGKYLDGLREPAAQMANPVPISEQASLRLAFNVARR